MDFQESPDSAAGQVIAPTSGQPATGHVWDTGRRASKACDNCRQKKIKCDESQPACRYCRRRKLGCHYRKDHQPARDPTLHLILEKLTQLHDEFRTLDGRVNNLENANAKISNPSQLEVSTHKREISNDQLTGGSTVDPVKKYRRSDMKPDHGHYHPAVTQRLSPAAPLPTSSMLQWKAVRDHHPTVSNRYLHLQDGMSSVYSATGTPPAGFLTATTHFRNEPGQVFFHIRNFLDLVYPLYPIICEQAIYDMVAEVVRDGLQSNIASVLILVMTVLGKLYTRNHDPRANSNFVADLDSASRLLNWLPLQQNLEHAQAHTLCALCFAKISMLSTAAFYLRQSCDILHEFLIRNVLVPSSIKLTTRTTSVRLYWVILNMERDMSWETSIVSSSRLGDLENRLPLPFECMVEESSSPGSSQAHPSQHLVIDSCYSLFLAETSLRQIIWRVATAPELQEYNHDSASAIAEPTSPRSKMLPSSLNIINELEMQLSQWLACIPVSAGWMPTPYTGLITPLSSRIRIQYWFCRFILHKGALACMLNGSYHGQTAGLLTQTWAHAAINAVMSILDVFVSEEFIPDNILTHRILIVIIILRSAIAILDISKIIPYCSTVTISPEVLLQRSIARLESFSSLSAPNSARDPGPHHSDPSSGEKTAWSSRWISGDLQNLLTDLNGSKSIGTRDAHAVDDPGSFRLRHLLA